MRKKIANLLILLFFAFCPLLFTACGKKSEPQDGVVSFTVNGDPWQIKQVRFIIQPWESMKETDMAFGEEVIRDTKSDHKFEFIIRMTKDRGYKSVEGMPTIYFWWEAITEDPENFVRQITRRSSINYRQLWMDNNRLKVEANPTNLDNARTSGEPLMYKDMWIQIDDFSKNRIKGRFGGPFIVAPSPLTVNNFERAKQTRIVNISDGKFDLPYVKLYR